MRALLPVLAAIALAASACGDTVSLDPVARAAETTTKQTSEHVELSMTATGPNGSRMSMNGSGDFQNDPQLGELTLAFASGGSSSLIHEVMKDWTVYMTSPLFAQHLPGGKTWLSLDMKKATKAFGIDITSLSGRSPGQMLDQLRSSGSVVRLGRERIDGVGTTHYKATVDLSKVPNGKKLVELTGIASEPVEVWVGSDGLVRRVQTSYSGAASGSVRMTMDFSNYGVPVYVQVPDDSVTFDATKLTEKLFHG